MQVKKINLQPLGVDDIKQQYSQFEKDTLEVIIGFSAGNMWIFRELCEECLDEMAKLKLNKVTMEIIEKFI